MALVLVLLNTYPLYASRDIIFESKKTNLQNQAALISTHVNTLDMLTEESVERVVEMLEVGEISQIVVANADGGRVFEDVYKDTPSDEEMVTWGIDEAIAGYDVFYSVFSGGTFKSSAAMPIVRGGEMKGAVYLYEHDIIQGEIVMSLQDNLQTFTFAVSVASVLMCYILSETFTRRIRRVLNAIKTVREGEYEYRVDIKGRDEISRLGDEFNSLTERLQSTEDVRRQFVSDASHELKTPLAAIRLLSDTILQNENIDPDTLHEFVSDINSEAERLSRTTEKLLSLTRLDNKNISVKRSCVDVEKVAESVVRVMRMLAAERGVTLNIKYTEDAFVYATEDDVFQIILNLTENAVKYNVENGRVDIIISNVGENVRIMVEDTGIGVPKEHIPNIFDRFYRVDKARSRASGGSGLGLAIIQSTVREHGGTVEAARRSEGGMCFAVILPRCEKENDE